MQYMPLPNLVTTKLNNNFQVVDQSPINKDQFTQRLDWVESDNPVGLVGTVGRMKTR
jgi:hypothetical protein